MAKVPFPLEEEEKSIDLIEMAKASSTLPGISLDRSRVPVPEEIPEGSLFKSVFMRDTTIGSFLRSPERGSFKAGETDPHAFISFVPERHMNNFASYALIVDQSEADTVTRALDKENEDTIRIAQSPIKAFAYGVPAQMLEPVNAFPGGIIFSNYKRMSRVAQGALHAATAGVVAGALQETIIQQNQLSRELDESIFNTLSSGIFGAAIGGAAGAFAPKTSTFTFSQKQRAVKGITEVFTDTATKLTENGLLTPDAIARMPEFVKEGMITSSMNRLFKSKYPTANQVANELFAHNYDTIKNRDGVANKNVEQLIALDISEKMGVLTDYQDIYFKQAGVERGFLAARRAEKAALQDPTGQILNLKTFDEQVAKYLYLDQIHENPSINSAVKLLREKVYDPFRDMAIANKDLPAGITPKNAGAYLPQRWNQRKITENQAGFLKDTVDGFTEVNEANKKIRKSPAYIKAQQELTETRKEVAKVKVALDRRGHLHSVAEAELKKQIDKLPSLKNPGEIIMQKNMIELSRKDVTKAKLRLSESKKSSKEAAEVLSKGRDKLTKAIKNAGQTVLKADEIESLFHHQGARKGELRKVSTSSEIKSAAEKSLDRILGRDTSKTNQHITSALNKRPQPLLDRTFLLSQERMWDWMNQSASDLTSKHILSMSASTRMSEAARGHGFNSIESWHDARLAALEAEFKAATKDVSGPDALKAEKQLKRDKKDVTDSFELLLGIYGDGPNVHDGSYAKYYKNFLNWNYIRLLGFMTLSAIPDVGLHVLTHGPYAAIHNGLVPVLKQTFGQLKKFSKDDLKAIGVAANTVSGTRLRMLAGIDAPDNGATYFGKLFNESVQGFGNVSLMNQWNDAQQLIAGTMSINRTLKTIETITLKKNTLAKDRERLARLGISESEIPLIHRMWEKAGKAQEDGTYFADWVNWKTTSSADIKALESFKAATLKEINQVVILPGLGDKPLFAHTPLGKIMLQFKSFQFAATNKILLSGIQRKHDINTYYGMVTLLSMGALSYVITQAFRGNDDIDFSFENLSSEAIDRSGLLGIISEVYNLANKAGLGFGAPTSRFQSRGVWGAILGPTTGLGEDLMSTINRIRKASDENPLTSKDLEQMLRLAPYQNLFYTHWISRKALRGAAPSLGFAGEQEQFKDIFK